MKSTYDIGMASLVHLGAEQRRAKPTTILGAGRRRGRGRSRQILGIYGEDLDQGYSDGLNGRPDRRLSDEYASGYEAGGLARYATESAIQGDAGSGGAPSLPLPDAPDEFGPGAGGEHYTDAPTIRAVQLALSAKGYKVVANGEFNPATEDALYRFGGAHGPPDDAMLKKLGVKPGGKSTSWFDFLMVNVPGVNIPVWQAGIGGIGILGVGAGIYTMVRAKR